MCHGVQSMSGIWLCSLLCSALVFFRFFVVESKRGFPCPNFIKSRVKQPPNSTFNSSRPQPESSCDGIITTSAKFAEFKWASSNLSNLCTCLGQAYVNPTGNLEDKQVNELFFSIGMS